MVTYSPGATVGVGVAVAVDVAVGDRSSVAVTVGVAMGDGPRVAGTAKLAVEVVGTKAIVWMGRGVIGGKKNAVGFAADKFLEAGLIRRNPVLVAIRIPMLAQRHNAIAPPIPAATIFPRSGPRGGRLAP